MLEFVTRYPLKKFEGLKMSIKRRQERLTRLYEFIRKNQQGECHILSGECFCPLCDLEGVVTPLVSRVKELEEALKETRCFDLDCGVCGACQYIKSQKQSELVLRQTCEGTRRYSRGAGSGDDSDYWYCDGCGINCGRDSVPRHP